jgi:hypothetical protein
MGGEIFCTAGRCVCDHYLEIVKEMGTEILCTQVEDLVIIMW